MPLRRSVSQILAWPWLEVCAVRPVNGRMSIRRAGRMHHLGVAAANARKRVLALADDHHITVIELDTGEVLSTHLIEPNKSYWRNETREPRPLAKLPELRPMSRLT